MIAALLDFAPLGNTPEKRQQYQKAADTALLLGTVGGAGAVATGWVEWSTARGQARRTGLIHGALNETAFLLNVGSLIARKKGRRGLGKASAALAWVWRWLAGCWVGNWFTATAWGKSCGRCIGRDRSFTLPGRAEEGRGGMIRGAFLLCRLSAVASAHRFPQHVQPVAASSAWFASR
ncbi:hypothetical protein [Deinococcus radiophilus]|uniref:hypothetical protein n=1 Tax=Deinococcus radiophilus TaxID=32062 RepID=UPI003616225D